MTPQTILIVDDEAQIRKFLRISLSANGYRVAEAETGTDAIRLAQEISPDLVILDLGLPDRDGQTIVTGIRQFSVVPIIVLSVRDTELDKVQALDRGANDYVVKPFGIAELMARIRAVLRPRPDRKDPQSLTLGDMTIDLARRHVMRKGTVIHLSKKEWDLLVFMAARPDHVLTHKHILKDVWGPAHVDDTAYLRVYINQLRQKLEDDPAQPTLILTDPGVGYRLHPLE